MKLLEAYAPIDRGNWPLIWDAIAFVIEAKFPKHVETHYDLTFDAMPHLERYRFLEPNEAAARFGPLLGGTEERPTLVLTAKHVDVDVPAPEGASEKEGWYEQAIHVRAKEIVWDREKFEARETDPVDYLVLGEDEKSFKFGDPKRLSKLIEA